VTDVRQPSVAEPRAESGTPPPHSERRSRFFPGDVWVWRAAGAVIAVLGIILLVELLQPREYFLGSNSVAARDYVVQVPAGKRMCVRDVRVPAGTQRIRWGIDTQNVPRVPVDMTVSVHGGPTLTGAIVRSSTTGFHKVDIPMSGPVPGGAPFHFADLCLAPKGTGGQIFVWGRSQPDITSKPIEVGKDKIPSRVALWFLPLAHERRSILSQVPQMFDRASLFRPGFYGPWVLWLILFAGLPALLYAAIRMIATADLPIRRRVPLPLAVALVAFAAATSWALVDPAFQSPDESEHFAYVQYLAETGKAVDLAQGTKPPWSTQEALVIDGTRELSVFERSEAKLPWLTDYQRDLRTRQAQQSPKGGPRDNGGGYHPATSTHAPLYYALLAPGYLAVRHQSVESQLLAMRLGSALMGALTAMFAVLLLLELLPGRRGLAVAAGLLVALEPMFAFISGAVNNDNGVNLACAAVIYLMVRALRRGLTVPVAVGLGAALVLAPIMKGTGYELYPPALLGLAGLLLRRHGRRDLGMVVVLLGAFAITFVGWDLVREAFHRNAFTTPGGGTPGTTFAANQNIKGYLVWMWQTLIPWKLPFMRDFTIIKWPFFNIYVQRGFAGFGWYAIFFPNWVYAPIVAAMGATAVLGTRMLWVERVAALRRWPELLFLASVPVVVLCAVEAAYFTLVIPLDGVAEQGRYAFPAITALAAIVIGGCLGLGRRRALPVAAALVAGLGMLLVAGQWLTLSTFYT
jgi:hypothetical protein